MSEWRVQVVKIGKVGKHPNADRLEITHVHGGYPCILRTEDFKEGDLAVYIPIDSVLPDTEPFAFLRESERKCLKAKKLRGIFSMGLLIPPPEGAEEGQDVADLLGVTKYEPPPSLRLNGECEPAPKGWLFPIYTDIEGFRRHPHLLQEGELVVVTEKLHGVNARYAHDGERLWVGSHRQIKRDTPEILWWQVARKENLAEKLAKHPMKVFFGEAYGQVQDLKYGHGPEDGASFRVFDVYDIKTGRYLDFDDARAIAEDCGLTWVPLLYRDKWQEEPSNDSKGWVIRYGREQLLKLAEGPSRLADHVREGIVIRPAKERWDETVGRVILKLHGQGYLLRKQK